MQIEFSLFSRSWALGGASLVAQTVKNLPVIQVTRVRSLGREDPLEKGMVTHSSILAWRVPWTEEPGGLPSTASQRVRHSGATNTFTSLPSEAGPENGDVSQWLCPK